MILAFELEMFLKCFCSSGSMNFEKRVNCVISGQGFIHIFEGSWETAVYPTHATSTDPSALLEPLFIQIHTAGSEVPSGRCMSARAVFSVRGARANQSTGAQHRVRVLGIGFGFSYQGQAAG